MQCLHLVGHISHITINAILVSHLQLPCQTWIIHLRQAQKDRLWICVLIPAQIPNSFLTQRITSLFSNALILYGDNKIYLEKLWRGKVYTYSTPEIAIIEWITAALSSCITIAIVKRTVVRDKHHHPTIIQGLMLASQFLPHINLCSL